MRNLAVVLLGVGLLACDKPNPNFCCSTEADCMAQGLPTANACADGLICRGNQCILEGCTVSGDCDAAAPYCESQKCAEMCTADPECPGFGEDPGDTFCVGGTCVACREMMDDCPTSAPVCDANACRGCRLDDECASGVCDVDTGTCIDETMILYASPTGTATADCSLATPCALMHAVSLAGQAQPVIRMLHGDYPVNISFPSTSPITVVGTGATLRGLGTGSSPALTVLSGATVTVRGLAIGPSVQTVGCAPTTGVATLTLRGVVLSISPDSEVLLFENCHLTLEEVTLNGINGDIEIGNNTTMVVDRSNIAGQLDAGVSSVNVALTVTNSILGQSIAATAAGIGPYLIHVSFSTIGALNAQGQNCISDITNHSILFDNDIILNDPTMSSNPNALSGPTSCYDHDLVFQQVDESIGTNMIFANPRFVDAPNGDFHLASNSPAIDSADPAATNPFDFDGVPRPQGTARDIGAFEFKP